MNVAKASRAILTFLSQNKRLLRYCMEDRFNNTRASGHLTGKTDVSGD